jgi:hypothetical protein
LNGWWYSNSVIRPAITINTCSISPFNLSLTFIIELFLPISRGNLFENAKKPAFLPGRFSNEVYHFSLLAENIPIRESGIKTWKQDDQKNVPVLAAIGLNLPSLPGGVIN